MNDLIGVILGNKLYQLTKVLDLDIRSATHQNTSALCFLLSESTTGLVFGWVFFVLAVFQRQRAMRHEMVAKPKSLSDLIGKSNSENKEF